MCVCVCVCVCVLTWGPLLSELFILHLYQHCRKRKEEEERRRGGERRHTSEESTHQRPGVRYRRTVLARLPSEFWRAAAPRILKACLVLLRSPKLQLFGTLLGLSSGLGSAPGEPRRAWTVPSPPGMTEPTAGRGGGGGGG